MSKSNKRPDWHNYFILIADAVKLRSPDPKMQVGAILVDSNNRIIGTGYNGLPPNINEECVDWGDRDTVRNIILHAESNCLLHSRITNSEDYRDCRLYCTHSPCCECLKMLLTCGIKVIFFKEKYKDYDNVEKTADLLNIKLIQIL